MLTHVTFRLTLTNNRKISVVLTTIHKLIICSWLHPIILWPNLSYNNVIVLICFQITVFTMELPDIMVVL